MTETAQPGRSTVLDGGRDTTSAWRLSVLALGLAISVIVVAYPDTIAVAYRVWVNSEAHRFSLLVVPMSLYLIWERRQQLQRLTPVPSPPALVLALPFGALWLVAESMHLATAAQVGVLGLLQTALLGLLGWRVYQALLFPFLFLWLLVPVGDSLIPSLIELTTHLTAAGVALFGLAVSIDGNIVISEAGRIGIVADCSALDFLIGNLVLSLFYATIVYSQPAKRVVYVLAGLLIAILANNVRTTGVILISHWTDGRWDLLSDHRLFGWLVFLAFVVLQMAVGARFKDARAEYVPAAADVAGRQSRHPGRRTLSVTLAMVVLVLIPPRLAGTGPTPGTLQCAIELDTPAWLLRQRAAAGDWRPVYRGAQASVFASDREDDRPVDLFIGYYWRQDERAELIGWPNAVYDGKSWHYLERDSIAVTRAGSAIDVTETRLRGPGRARRLTWHWYWVDGRFVAGPLAAKLLQAKAALLGGDRRAAVIVVSAPANDGREAARASMQALLDRATFLEPMLSATDCLAPE